MGSLSLWIGFNLFILFLLALDLGVFNKKSHDVSVKEALTWSGVWIAIALLFNVGLYYFKGSEIAFSFLAGYLIEKSLSVDNIFVFLMIFSYFNVPSKYQHKVLFYGIIGALLMRAGMIVAGSALISNFHWTIYIFGAFLAFTGIKMLVKKDDDSFNPENNFLVKSVKKFIPITKEYHEDKLFIRNNGVLMATPLFLVLLVVEFSDVIFAVDSIPAIFGVTQDPFIVYTSNVFAILGLRSLYFALAGIMHKFEYLKVGLSFVLVFIGAKMLIMDFYKIPIAVSLGVVSSILTLSVVVSLIKTKDKPEENNITSEEKVLVENKG
ncbi:MAG: TerC family protein [Candidatus Sericytochromatia bacterium]